MGHNYGYQLARQVTLTNDGLAFVRALAELNGSTFDWLRFLEKPHHWHEEYRLWVENGRPLDDTEPGWDRFAMLALQV